VLTISVWAEPSLSGRYTVEADGSFTYPLIGRVVAGGLTLKATEQELVKRLSDGFLKKPQVAVTVEQHASQVVFVVGEVRQPGSFPLTGDTTLLAILARAGSVTPTASGEVVVVRPQPDTTTTGPAVPEETSELLRIKIDDLHTSVAYQQFQLKNGDTVFVPRAESVFVFGQVRNPGAFPIQKGTTVLQALALAGGLTERGTTSRLRIVRVTDGRRVSIKAEVTDLVQPGDTVMVSQRFF
jgi:polysaccharide export outer membrane protein